MFRYIVNSFKINKYSIFGYSSTASSTLESGRELLTDCQLKSAPESANNEAGELQEHCSWSRRLQTKLLKRLFLLSRRWSEMKSLVIGIKLSLVTLAVASRELSASAAIERWMSKGSRKSLISTRVTRIPQGSVAISTSFRIICWISSCFSSTSLRV